MLKIQFRPKEDDGKIFNAAVEFFVRAMRARDFVTASELLCEKYGAKIALAVEAHCWNECVTFRGVDGRLHLAREYKNARYKETLKARGLC